MLSIVQTRLLLYLIVMSIFMLLCVTVVEKCETYKLLFGLIFGPFSHFRLDIEFFRYFFICQWRFGFFRKNSLFLQFSLIYNMKSEANNVYGRTLCVGELVIDNASQIFNVSKKWIHYLCQKSNWVRHGCFSIIHTCFACWGKWRK